MKCLFRPSCMCCLAVTICVLCAVPPAALGQQAIAVSSILPKKPQAGHPLDPALEMAYASLQHIRTNVDDYSALFVKRCRVDGTLPPLQYAHLKIRNRKTENQEILTPMSVYLDFLKPSSVKGREVIWVEGTNEGKLIAHETGYKGFVNVNLDPNGFLAMRGQRHPITEIGIEKLIEKLIDAAERDRKYGECEVNFFRDATIGKTSCTMLEVVHPEKRAHFDFHRARVYFDNNLNVPIRYESWSWPVTPGGPPVREEEYTYINLKVNVGFTDLDFDITNPAYRFR